VKGKKREKNGAKEAKREECTKKSGATYMARVGQPVAGMFS
jgi:hypothetical protein